MKTSDFEKIVKACHSQLEHEKSVAHTLRMIEAGRYRLPMGNSIPEIKSRNKK